MNLLSKDGRRPGPEDFPLPPEPEASKECLLGRLHLIHERLVSRGFSDAVASRAVDVALDVGKKALASGKAGRMDGGQRAGWLWTVALTAAKRAAAGELIFLPLKMEPAYSHALLTDGDDDALAKAVRKGLDRLPPEQKQAVELHVMQGLSIRAAAREMGVRASTAERRCRAGISRLKASLASVSEAARGEKIPPDSGARAC
jgi:DNA-directed RNA polymerase specialized sigma24 family protein